MFFLLNFGDRSFSRHHWYLCFGLLVSSALPWVDSLACVFQCLHAMDFSNSVVVLTCWPLDTQHGSWTFLIHILLHIQVLIIWVIPPRLDYCAIWFNTISQSKNIITNLQTPGGTNKHRDTMTYQESHCRQGSPQLCLMVHSHLKCITWLRMHCDCDSFLWGQSQSQPCEQFQQKKTHRVNQPWMEPNSWLMFYILWH